MLIVMSPKHVLMPHHTHRFVVNVQPNHSIATACVRMEHVDCIMPVTCGCAVVVEHLSMYRAGSASCPATDAIMSGSELRRILSPERRAEEGGRRKTDFEVRSKLDTLANLDSATRSRVLHEALEMEDK